MNKVIVKSRIPKITAEMKGKMDEVAKAGADLIVATAKERVPVETGDLRDSIHEEKVKLGTHAVVAGDQKVFYGHLVEHGTTHSAPEPFLIPSMEADKPEVVALGKAALDSL